MSRAPDQVAMDRVYGLFHYITTVVWSMWFRGEVSGMENIPTSGAFLVASNHASHLDPPVVGGMLPRQVCFFARKSLWKPGIASWWLDEVGTIPVDRDGGSDITAIKRVLRALAEEKVIILFPEGTRSPDGNLQTPKPGVGLIACKTQVPVVPVRVFGSFEAFGRAGGLRPGNPIHVVFGPPIAPADYDPGKSKDRYQITSERIMERIAALRLPPVTII